MDFTCIHGEVAVAESDDASETFLNALEFEEQKSQFKLELRQSSFSASGPGPSQVSATQHRGGSLARVWLQRRLRPGVGYCKEAARSLCRLN